MAKRKLTLLAQAIALVNQLSNEEQQTVADLIRLEQRPSKKASKKKSTVVADDKEAAQPR